MDLRLIDDRSTAQVVPIGEGKFGVIWNGELRPEKYPAKGIAYLAIAALRRHESPPTAPVDEIWLGTSLDRKKLTQALPSLPETADELEAVAAKLGDSAYRRRTPYKKLYDEMNFQRAVLCYLWATQNVGMEGSGYFSSSTRQGLAANPPPPVQSFSRCSTQVLRIPARSG